MGAGVIVIDLGCYEHEVSKSVEPLIEQFHPEVLYGFDPLLPRSRTITIDETRCILSRKAAWTHAGRLGIRLSGTGTQVYEDPAGDVICFDLAKFIARLPAKEPVVLKLDVEGAEYPLLEHLRDKGLDLRLTLALVEWHSLARVELMCPIQEWTL